MKCDENNMIYEELYKGEYIPYIALYSYIKTLYKNSLHFKAFITKESTWPCIV